MSEGFVLSSVLLEFGYTRRQCHGVSVVVTMGHGLRHAVTLALLLAVAALTFGCGAVLLRLSPFRLGVAAGVHHSDGERVEAGCNKDRLG